MGRVRLRSSAIGSGLDSFEKAYDVASKVIQDYQNAKIAREIGEKWSLAEREAADSGGIAFDSDRYRAGLGLSGAGGQQAEMLRQQDESFGKDALAAARATQDAMTYSDRPLHLGVAPSSKSGQNSRTESVQSAPSPSGASAPKNPATPQSATPPRSAPAAQSMPTAAQGLPVRPDIGVGQERSDMALAAVERPALDARQIFAKKYAPSLISKYIKSGDMEKAKAFSDWVKSEAGAAYGEAYTKAMLRATMGDMNGALADVTKIYNTMIPDGQYAITRPKEDGKFVLEIRDEKTNKLLRTQEGTAEDLVTLGLGMGPPDKVFEYFKGQQAAAVKRKQEIEDREARQAHEIALERTKAGGQLPSIGKLHMYRSALEAQLAQAKQSGDKAAIDDLSRRIKEVDSEIQAAALGDNRQLLAILAAHAALQNQQLNLITKQTQHQNNQAMALALASAKKTEVPTRTGRKVFMYEVNTPIGSFILTEDEYNRLRQQYARFMPTQSSNTAK